MSNKKYNRYRLLMMAKAPELGKVKTRMQPQLTPKESQQLHIALVNQCLHTWESSKLCDIDVWIGGNIAIFKNALAQEISLDDVPLYAQAEGDLGVRMSFAVHETFNSGEVEGEVEGDVDGNVNGKVNGVILVGGDCPFIDEDYIESAILALKKHDVVIGPANDGGYVLLGLSQDTPQLFENIDWGTESVFEATLKIVEREKLSYKVLPALSDIDRPEDLKQLDQKHFSKSLQFFSYKR